VAEDSLDLARLTSGDKQAWDAFVTRYAGVVHAAVSSVLRHSGRDFVDSSDLAQDVFVRLCKDGYRLLGQYDPKRASPVTWLTMISRSVALDAIRRKSFGLVPIEDAPESALAVQPVERHAVKIPPGLLTPRQELILAMLYDRDMSPAEVAEALDVDVQTIRSMHHKALVRLRLHFREEIEG
jgi:RNA polymerase sigma factor (sigma-70 family)